MTPSDLAELDGVSAARAHQTLAGAIVAAAAMDALEVDELQLCPWALREGVILSRLDQLTAAAAAPARDRDELMRVAPSEAKVGCRPRSVYPEPTAAAFEIAAALGYDGVEVMVGTDPASQDADELARLSDEHGVAILAIHAPCLVITQRVWSTDPWEKLQRAQAVAERLGAQTVVVHPPFRWQREYARDVPARPGRDGRRDRRPLRGREHVPVAGARARGVGLRAELGRHRPASRTAHYTLDLSHTSVSHTLGPRRCSTRWAIGWRTCTSPTASAPTATSTSCPAAATSRAPRCSSAPPRAGSPVT